MRGISDGYVLFDDEDVWRKVRGPAKVEVLSDKGEGEQISAIALCGPQAEEALRQALGSAFPEQLGNQALVWAQILYADHITIVARCGHTLEDTWYTISGSDVALRALWDALTEAGAAPSASPKARHALREAAGLPARWPEDEIKREASSLVDRLPHMFDLRKPYFVGQHALPRPEAGPERPAFAWAEPVDLPSRRTPLYEEHVRLGAKMVPFAGWKMPVWYTRVGDEHRAVREAAGLFDVAHMGTLEVSGPHAADFLDLVTVNYVRWLEDGESQYSALLDADGHILDDVLVYRRAQDRYFVVANAVNFDKDWAWLNAVNRDEVPVDALRPWVRVLHPATLRDLRDPSSGPDRRIDVALQGPRSRQILLACVDDPALRARLRNLERTMFLEGTVGGIDLLVSRTGYTGEAMGFELYVHPDRAVDLWRLLLERGAPYGIVPCGLAARDSLRIEAGLPLYGHELAGPLGISQTEAGFGAYVKYHQPFFVGRAPYKAYNDQSTRRIVRFAVSERGARAIRGGEHGEPVLNRRGKVIGTVTSCALVGEQQVGMALVEGRYTEPGTELFIYPEARRVVGKVPQELTLGDNVALPVRAEVLARFPSR
jgi:glycine hydroxymethyltransferase